MSDTTLSNNAFTLELANAIWPQTGFPLHDTFVRTVHDLYEGEAQSIDYGNLEQAKQTINAWVKEKTHDRIPDLIKQLPANTLMSLTNAIYLKSAWANFFDPKQTTDNDFAFDDGSSVSVPTMHMEEDFAVLQGDSFRALEMPLQGGRASVVFVLPYESTASATSSNLGKSHRSTNGWPAHVKQSECNWHCPSSPSPSAPT